MSEIEGTAQQTVYDITTAKTLFETANKYGSDSDGFYDDLSDRITELKGTYTSSDKLDKQGLRSVKFAYALVLLSYERGSENFFHFSELMNRNPDKFFQTIIRSLCPEAQKILAYLDKCESSIQWAIKLDPSLKLEEYADIYKLIPSLLKQVRQVKKRGESIYLYLHGRINTALQTGLDSQEFRFARIACALVLTSCELGSKKFKQYVRLLEENSKAFSTIVRRELSPKAQRVLQRFHGIESTLDLFKEIFAQKPETRSVIQPSDYPTIYKAVGKLNIEIAKVIEKGGNIYQSLENQLRIALDRELDFKQFTMLKIVSTLVLISHEFRPRYIRILTKLLGKEPETFLQLTLKMLSPRARKVLKNIDDNQFSTRVEDLESRLGDNTPPTDRTPHPQSSLENGRLSLSIETVQARRLIATALGQEEFPPDLSINKSEARQILAKIHERLRLEEEFSGTHNQQTSKVLLEVIEILNTATTIQ